MENKLNKMKSLVNKELISIKLKTLDNLNNQFNIHNQETIQNKDKKNRNMVCIIVRLTTI